MSSRPLIHRHDYAKIHKDFVDKIVKQTDMQQWQKAFKDALVTGTGSFITKDTFRMSILPPLMAHQKEAIPALAAGHAFLAFEPGLGKTRTTIEALDSLASPARTQRILVICPAIARENWKREFDKWGRIKRTVQIGRPGDAVTASVFITNYDLISLMKPTTREKFLKHDWDALILDEAHRLKDRTANRTKYVYGSHASMTKAIAAKAKRVWLLSGTPCPNHLGELWTHLKALAPKTIATLDGTPMRLDQFEDAYCKVRTSQFGRQIYGSKNAAHLRKAMGAFFIPKREKDCLDLPPLSWDTYALPTDDLLEAHQKILKDIDKALAPYVSAPDPVDALRGAGAHIATERKLLGKLKAPVVARYIVDELENSPPDHKIIVFAQHTDVIDTLNVYLAQYSPVVIDGRVNDKARNKAIDDFQNTARHRVFIGQIQATGEAINLTKARRIIFAEPSWTPKDNFQCVKRAHRIGQTGHVRCTYAVFANSMDARIIRSVEQKTRDMTGMMD